jgi:hypothetical protein
MGFYRQPGKELYPNMPETKTALVPATKALATKALATKALATKGIPENVLSILRQVVNTDNKVDTSMTILKELALQSALQAYIAGALDGVGNLQPKTMRAMNQLALRIKLSRELLTNEYMVHVLTCETIKRMNELVHMITTQSKGGKKQSGGRKQSGGGHIQIVMLMVFIQLLLSTVEGLRSRSRENWNKWSDDEEQDQASYDDYADDDFASRYDETVTKPSNKKPYVAMLAGATGFTIDANQTANLKEGVLPKIPDPFSQKYFNFSDPTDEAQFVNEFLDKPPRLPSYANITNTFPLEFKDKGFLANFFGLNNNTEAREFKAGLRKATVEVNAILKNVTLVINRICERTADGVNGKFSSRLPMTLKQLIRQQMWDSKLMDQMAEFSAEQVKKEVETFEIALLDEAGLSEKEDDSGGMLGSITGLFFSPSQTGEVDLPQDHYATPIRNFGEELATEKRDDIRTQVASYEKEAARLSAESVLSQAETQLETRLKGQKIRKSNVRDMFEFACGMVPSAALTLNEAGDNVVISLEIKPERLGSAIKVATVIGDSAVQAQKGLRNEETGKEAPRLSEEETNVLRNIEETSRALLLSLEKTLKKLVSLKGIEAAGTPQDYIGEVGTEMRELFEFARNMDRDYPMTALEEQIRLKLAASKVSNELERLRREAEIEAQLTKGKMRIQAEETDLQREVNVENKASWGETIEGLKGTVGGVVGYVLTPITGASEGIFASLEEMVDDASKSGHNILNNLVWLCARGLLGGASLFIFYKMIVIIIARQLRQGETPPPREIQDGPPDRLQLPAPPPPQTQGGPIRLAPATGFGSAAGRSAPGISDLGRRPRNHPRNDSVDDLSASFGNLGLGLGGRGRNHKKTRKQKKTKTRKLNRGKKRQTMRKKKRQTKHRKR